MRLLLFQIGMGNHRARLAQPKAQLPEQALTLTHRQVNLEASLDPGTQRFSIPQCAAQADVARGLAQRPLHFFELRITQTSGTPGALPFAQPGQTSCLEPPDPILHRTGRVAQPPADLRTGHALRYQQHPVESVIIARFVRTANRVLQSQNHRLGISNLEWSHVSMKPQFAQMRKYL